MATKSNFKHLTPGKRGPSILTKTFLLGAFTLISYIGMNTFVGTPKNDFGNPSRIQEAGYSEQSNSGIPKAVDLPVFMTDENGCYKTREQDTLTTVAMVLDIPPTQKNLETLATEHGVPDINLIHPDKLFCPIDEELLSNDVCYTAEPGEGLYTIMQKLGIPWENLILFAEDNNIDNIHTIPDGKEFKCYSITKDGENVGYIVSSQDIGFMLTYYNPIRGDVNCNTDCKFTGSGERVLEDDLVTKVGDWWDPEQNYGWTAAPLEYPFDTQFKLIIPTGEILTLEKQDNGGAIIVTGEGLIRLDILYDDGLGPDDLGWSLPQSREGYTLNGEVPKTEEPTE